MTAIDIVTDLEQADIDRALRTARRFGLCRYCLGSGLMDDDATSCMRCRGEGDEPSTLPELKAGHRDDVEPPALEVVPMRDAWATWGAHLPEGSAIVVMWTDGIGSERIVNGGQWCYPDMDSSLDGYEVEGSAFAKNHVRLLATLAPLPENFGQPRPEHTEAWEPQPGDLCSIAGDESDDWPLGAVVQVLRPEDDGDRLVTTDPAVRIWTEGVAMWVDASDLRPATPDEAAAWRAKHGPLAVGDVIPEGVDEPSVEALPVGSVIRDKDGDEWARHDRGWGAAKDCSGMGPWGAGGPGAWLPATVVRVGPAPEPEAETCGCADEAAANDDPEGCYCHCADTGDDTTCEHGEHTRTTTGAGDALPLLNGKPVTTEQAVAAHRKTIQVMRRRIEHVTRERDNARAEVARLARELNDARDLANTAQARAVTAENQLADLRAHLADIARAIEATR